MKDTRFIELVNLYIYKTRAFHRCCSCFKKFFWLVPGRYKELFRSNYPFDECKAIYVTPYMQYNLHQRCSI